MVLLTNPQTADLQQRIQNSSFGSPDYLQGFTGTMPGYQQNLLANNYQPGLITRDFSGAGTSLDGSGVANYLSYTPGVPPQYTETGFQLPYQNMVNAAVRQGGGSNASDANQAARDLAMQGPYGAAQERATAADQANTAANQRNLARETGGGAGQDTSGPEASGSGAVGSTGPTGRSRGGW